MVRRPIDPLSEPIHTPSSQWSWCWTLDWEQPCCSLPTFSPALVPPFALVKLDQDADPFFYYRDEDLRSIVRPFLSLPLETVRLRVLCLLLAREGVPQTYS
jgi:hypothetical protein